MAQAQQTTPVQVKAIAQTYHVVAGVPYFNRAEAVQIMIGDRKGMCYA